MKKELENLSESDKKVCELLASLKQVEAPKDFEFRLKARIAGANAKAYKTNYKRRLAYALPAFASIAVSAFVVVNGNFFGGANEVSSLPETTATSGFTVAPQNPANQFIAANAAVNKETEEASATNSDFQNRKDEKPKLPLIAVEYSKPKKEIRQPAFKENFGGSKVEATTETRVLTPKGINLNVKPETPQDFNSENPISVQELLSPLGVEVVAENGKWKVKNVSQNSAAERSGIKTDDVIETLDGRKLSGAPLRGKKIEVKKLGVKRAGALVEINLQPNPK
jgi:membrane-associated protease RseP (regulator of RpoE activity)